MCIYAYAELFYIYNTILFLYIKYYTFILIIYKAFKHNYIINISFVLRTYAKVINFYNMFNIVYLISTS